MSATMSYYPPSTTGTTITSWLPMTTTFGYRGSGSNTFCMTGTATYAYLANNDGCAWVGKILPPEVSLASASSYAVDLVGSTRLSIGPFAGCPQSWSAIETRNNTMTVCCPPSFAPSTVNSVVYCTSTYSSASMTLMSYILVRAPNITISLLGTNRTSSTNYYTSTSFVVNLTSPAIITAPPLSGYNFAQAPADGPTSKSPDPTSTCSSALSGGVIAGLTVTSILAVIGLITLIIGAFMLTGKRRSRARTGGGGGQSAAAAAAAAMPHGYQAGYAPPKENELTAMPSPVNSGGQHMSAYGYEMANTPYVPPQEISAGTPHPQGHYPRLQ